MNLLSLRSLPALVNIGSVLFIIMFVYSISGMALFGNMKLQTNLDIHVSPGTCWAWFRPRRPHTQSQKGEGAPQAVQGAGGSVFTSASVRDDELPLGVSKG